MSDLISNPMTESAFHPGDRIGLYRLIEMVGSGGQGEVWRAKDERFDRDVALKILPSTALADDSARNRFRREALAVGKLNHPNIATAHDFDTKPLDFLVTEFVYGTGLDQRLKLGALPEETVIDLGLQLAAGLEAAHGEGIIHRDLKPGNIRINQQGKLKILDFGLAEMFDPTKDVASLETVTINMTLTGTLPYMAPEQFTGFADQRTDLWSAGAVLYEMATGKLPFPEEQVLELRLAIEHKEPIKPRDVNPQVSVALEQVILRCLKKNPTHRYQTARDLREDLERLQQGRKTKTGEKLQGRRFAHATLAVVLALSAFAGYRYWPEIRDKLWPAPGERVEQFRLMAILPIEAGIQDPGDNALVRGMAETVSAHISRATQGQKLQLIPPSELISRGAKTPEAVRQEFGVERVLEVSVQRSGDKVRVTCSLIDPKTHQLLNACSVTGDKNDLFALQDNLVGQVIAMLPAAARSLEAAPTVVQAAQPAAYESYLKGRGNLMEYQKTENIDAAIKEFQRALEISPGYALAYAGLGEAYWRGYEAHRGKQWLDTATSNCKKALQADPKLAAAHTCLGNIYVDTGKYQDAAQEFQRALSIEPDNTDALSGLAESLDRMGNIAAAEETYKKAVAVRPQYWAVYNWLGTFYFNHARYDQAEAMFRKVTELRPDNHRGHYNLGGIYLLEGKYDDANRELNRSIELRPTMAAYSNLGTSYFYQHRYPDAVAAYEKACGLDDQDFMNWGNLADALYWSPTRRAEAAAAYKRGITLAGAKLQINPKDAKTRAYMAQYSAMSGDKANATAEIQKALQSNPTDPDVWFRAALIYYQLGDKKETLRWLNRAVNAQFSRSAIRDTPDFEPLHADPVFIALIAKE